jgi:CelD/BcsL family acetyltransferase involved in cellulose biosynthesis
MQLARIESISQLREQASRWDDLWWRSGSSLPTARAEMLAQWVEHFAPGERFLALVVDDGGRWVGALPLVGGKLGGALPVGKSPSNCWAESGGLHVDAKSDLGRIAQTLAAGISQAPWPVLSLSGADRADTSWLALFAALDQRGLPIAARPEFHLGLIDLVGDWDACQAAWSSNHRTAVKKSLRKLAERGEVRLRQYRDLEPERLAELLRCCFEIEDKSWKGAEGTSIQSTPGMFEFFHRQAQGLAGWGQLEVLTLEVAGQPIAFEYCYVAKGVTYSHKIGYDPAFRQFGPGRLLRYLQLEQYYAEGDRRLFDTMGILCESKAKWCTRSRLIERYLVGTGGLTGSAALWAYRRLWPVARRVLRRDNEFAPPPKLGAARLLDAMGSESVKAAIKGLESPVVGSASSLSVLA